MSRAQRMIDRTVGRRLILPLSRLIRGRVCRGQIVLIVRNIARALQPAR